MARSTSQANPMTALYARLQQAGFSRAFVRKYALPAWWCDESALNPSGFAMARGYIARHLGVSLEALQNPSTPLKCAYELTGRNKPKFKLRSNVQESEAQWAACLAARVAEIAVTAAPRATRQIPKDGVSLREAILRSGAPWVGLEDLLDYCWDLGIPVLHLSHFPGGKKMDGMAAMFEGRPAIVIAKNHKHNAWLSFILAHELGHIACGHLSNAPFIFDEAVRSEAAGDDEDEANRFATELLTGDDEAYSGDYWFTAEQLAEIVQQTGERHRVDPGVIALNYAFHRGHMAVGQGALNLLYPQADAIGIIRHKLQERLNWHELSDDTAEYLRRICGLDSED
jgi:hypothetical protein